MHVLLTRLLLHCELFYLLLTRETILLDIVKEVSSSAVILADSFTRVFMCLCTDGFCSISQMYFVLDPVVRKPINANPRLKINRGFHLAYFKCFQELILS